MCTLRKDGQPDFTYCFIVAHSAVSDHACSTAGLCSQRENIAERARTWFLTAFDNDDFAFAYRIENLLLFVQASAVFFKQVFATCHEAQCARTANQLGAFCLWVYPLNHGLVDAMFPQLRRQPCGGGFLELVDEFCGQSLFRFCCVAAFFLTGRW